MTKRQNPQLFKVVRNLKVKTSQLSSSGRNQPEGMSGMSELGSLIPDIGNQWLLERGVGMQMRCHNNNTPENLKLIEQQTEYFLDRGQRGGGEAWFSWSFGG